MSEWSDPQMSQLACMDALIMRRHMNRKELLYIWLEKRGVVPCIPHRRFTLADLERWAAAYGFYDE